MELVFIRVVIVKVYDLGTLEDGFDVDDCFLVQDDGNLRPQRIVGIRDEIRFVTFHMNFGLFMVVDSTGLAVVVVYMDVLRQAIGDRCLYSKVMYL